MRIAPLIRKSTVYLLTLFLLLVYTSFVPANDVQYIYDDLGRLNKVLDDQGNVTIYTYDAVGNLLSISNTSDIDPVAIVDMNPAEGPIGTVVTLYGKGFSSTPSENSVTFNGTSAPVTSSTSNVIMTIVPSGATTGPVAVQTPSGSAASSNAFIIRDPVSIVISPSFAFLSPGRSRQFAATVTGIANSSVIWSVEGLLGGSSITGTITDGLYTAPSSIYQPAVVTITARSVVDPAIKADVPVYLNVERIVSNSVSVIVQPQPQLVVQGPFVSPDVSVVVQPQSQLVTQGPFVSPDVSVVVQPQPQLISQGPFIAPNISLAIGPYIDSISPTSGVQGGNYQMTITGIGFSGVSAVDFYLNGTIDTGIAVSNFQVNTDGTQITADVNISPAATANIRLVKITALYGTSQGYYSNGNIFTVTTP